MVLPRDGPVGNGPIWWGRSGNRNGTSGVRATSRVPLLRSQGVAGVSARAPRAYLMSCTPRATGTLLTGRVDVTGPVKNGLRQTPSMSLPPLQLVSWKPA
jgi:hypothetical protein